MKTLPDVNAVKKNSPSRPGLHNPSSGRTTEKMILMCLRRRPEVMSLRLNTPSTVLHRFELRFMFYVSFSGGLFVCNFLLLLLFYVQFEYSGQFLKYSEINLFFFKETSFVSLGHHLVLHVSKNSFRVFSTK